MSQIVLYTVITNSYDLEPPIEVLDNVDLILITDEKTKASINKSWKNWKIINIDTIDISNLLNKMPSNKRNVNRLLKLCPHLIFSNYEISVYTDSNNKLNTNFIKLLEEFKSDEESVLYLLNHRKRKSVYDEIKECLFWGKDYEFRLKYQYKYYKNLYNYKSKSLYDGSFLIRRHNEIREFSNEWFNHYKFLSSRDQISLPVVIDLYKLKFKPIENVFYKKNNHNYVSYENNAKRIKIIRNKFISTLIEWKRKIYRF